MSKDNSDTGNKAQRMTDDIERLRRARSNWLNQWQLVGEFVSQIKQDFETTQSVGEFLNDEIFDSTGTFAAHNSASALLGILWPSDSSNNVQIVPPSNMEDVTDEEREWYVEVATKRLVQAMDAPSANLALTLDEYMLDQVIFGTSGIGVFWANDALLYKPFGVKETIIDEGVNALVDVTYILYEWSPRRVVEEYGIDNVSSKVREMFLHGKDNEKVKIAIGFFPRRDVDPEGEGNLNMPFESLHIEVETKHILKESGFEEFPISVVRFRKLSYEKYGRSPAMNALPDIKELNILREAIIVATEKILDPPLGLLSDGMLGGGVVDTSSGALNVFDVQSNVGNTPPIFPISTVGDISVAAERISDLQESVAQHFFIDRLLDFNNKTQMTATETAVRDQIRSSSLSSLVTRQISEGFTPAIQRSFNLMMRNDKLGFIQGTPEHAAAELLGEEITIIPERIAKRLLAGEEAYDVTYTTPAIRQAGAEELRGLLTTVDFMQGLMQTNPEAQAYLDVEKISENITRLTGAPPEIIHSKEEVEGIQQEQAAQVKEQQDLDSAQQVADIAKTAREAEAEQDNG